MATDTNLPALKGMADEITADHNAHVAALQQLLGTSAPPTPAFQSLDAPTLPQFVTMAQSIEDFAVGAQQGVVLAALQSAAPGSSPAQLLTTEVAILADDARLDGGLHGWRKVAGTADGGDPNTTLTPTGTPLGAPLTREQVLAFLQPYLAAANATPGTSTPAPATAGTTTPSTSSTGAGATTAGSSGTTTGP